MIAYNYELNFSSIKKWLPQTTQKILYYLENLAASNGQDKFDVNKTRWELCAKPKNGKAAAQVEKIVKESEPDIDQFKKLLELSHIVEIYVKAFFDKITYRSNSITYLSYKNQHDYMSRASQKKAEENPGLTATKSVKIEFKDQDISYSYRGSDKTIYAARLFKFEDSPITYIMGFHSSDEAEIKSYTLYEMSAGIVKIKYYIDEKTAQAILAIKDLMVHEVMGKKIKMTLEKVKKLEML